MRAIIDPIAGNAMCGCCGALFRRWDRADECCDPPDPPQWKAILAGSIVLLSCIFLFVVLPLL